MGRKRRIIVMVVFVMLYLVSGINLGFAQQCPANPNGPVSWWSMDGTVVDVVGNNSPSSTYNVTYKPGASFDGVSLYDGGNLGYIDIPHSDDLALQQFSIVSWVYPEAGGPNPDRFGSVIVGKNHPPDFGNVNISVGTWWSELNYRFRFGIGYIYDDSEIIASSYSYPPGNFYFLVVTYDGSTMKMYVDGILDVEQIQSKTINYDSTIPWVIGSTYDYYRNIGWPRTFKGVIDEVGIFDRALTACEIQKLMKMTLKKTSCPLPVNCK